MLLEKNRGVFEVFVIVNVILVLRKLQLITKILDSGFV